MRAGRHVCCFARSYDRCPSSGKAPLVVALFGKLREEGPEPTVHAGITDGKIGALVL